MAMAKKYPHLKLVVQDRGPVTKDGFEVCCPNFCRYFRHSSRTCSVQRWSSRRAWNLGDFPSRVRRAHFFLSNGQLMGEISEEHDFFTVNPVKNADVFMAKYVIHDWSNKYSLEILKRLREAAAPHTKLVLLDKIIPYMCPLSAIEESANEILVPGFLKPDVPEPIIQMSGTSHMSSVVVRTYCR